MLAQWNRIKSIPGGRWVFSRVLGWTVPYVGPLWAQVQDLEPGRAVVKMADRRALRNHLGSVHAVALVNLGELTANLALTTLQPKRARWIVTRVEADYLKKARGMVRGETRLEQNNWQELGETPQGVSELFDESGDLVCRLRVHWNIKS